MPQPFTHHKNTYPHFFYVIAFIPLVMLSACSNPNYRQSPKAYTHLRDSILHVLNHSNYVKAMYTLDQAAAKYKNLSVADQFEHYQLHCDYYSNIAPNYSKAWLYADTMLNVLKTSGHPQDFSTQFGVVYFSLGDIAFKKQDYTEAYQYYYKVKETGNKNLNNCTLSDYNYRLGMVLYKQEHYSLATAYFKEAFAKAGTCNQTFVYFYRRQELLDNIALSFYKTGMLDSAQIYYNKTLNLLNTEGKAFPDKAPMIDVARGVVYGNLAQLYTIKKDYKKAISLLTQSFTINLKKDNDNRDAQFTELKLAHIYFDQRNNALLYPLLQNIRKQLDTVKNTDAELDWNHLMAQYYQNNNQSNKALVYFNTYANLKDSVDHANQKLFGIDPVDQVEDFENQTTINKLRTDNGIQHIYLSAAIVCAVMAALIVLMIFVNWKKSRRNVTALSLLNSKINEQNETLQKTFSELERNDKEKDRIMRAVAHDLRNPIAGIASLTTVMLMENNLHDDHRELLNLIKETTNNSLELIGEILEATGSTPNKAIKKEPVDINTLVSHSIELLRFKAAEKKQKIHLETLNHPQELVLSREKMWRVLSNLISNAIKFSPEGADIDVRINQNHEGTIISVTDYGIGIPNELKDLIFNMFTPAKRTGTIGEPSYGLGLSISKQIIEKHDGKIWFESTPNKGSVFYILLKNTTQNHPAATV